MNKKHENIILNRAISIVNSAARILNDGIVEPSFYPADFLPVKNIDLGDFASEFCIDHNCGGKVFLAASKSTVQNLSLALFGMPITDEDGEEMVQDGINEILNMIIGNAAKELEELGLNFGETLIPTKGRLTDISSSSTQYQIGVPTEVGELSFVFSFNNSKAVK